jgi:hypothetical protein
VETSGPYVDGLQKIFNHLKANGVSIPHDFLTQDEQGLKRLCWETPGVSDVDRERAELAITLYRLLYQKYYTSFTELDAYIAQLKAEAFPHLEKLKQALNETDS